MSINNMKYFLIILSVIFVIAIVTFSIFEFRHPCIKEHTEMVHYDAWTQMFYTGHGFFPIYHPEEDVLETVCDLRK